ncbi:Fur family transcriptional regulator, ferric uptake regulator [Gillisia sp. Hel1_33_143]|uniref:Fur family transcriptional regulator n=1 Tax=Gillisia sp. Hel1_33_143 TaxID=1336796 RepID=UPI000879B7F2|nr:transcriptional repressor [Gillisia sp. Hel1_33_143]SDR69502.1 Fur family transcriptional regulator, ferric uptake regulator [Gillisia sp. Hel1_33_143]
MEDIVKKLEDKGVKPTAMRLLTYKYLSKMKVAISLGELEKHFKSSERSTLFRTIKTFEEYKLVHAIEDGSGLVKYALCSIDCQCEMGIDLHLHFHCNKCDETICLTDHKIPQINLPEGFKAENINLIVQGICIKCGKEGQGSL